MVETTVKPKQIRAKRNRLRQKGERIINQLKEPAEAKRLVCVSVSLDFGTQDPSLEHSTQHAPHDVPARIETNLIPLLVCHAANRQAVVDVRNVNRRPNPDPLS